MNNNLPITEELDFHYLLSLMPPLKDEPGFQWLPELFSIIGVDSLILLCKYCDGETIKIPSLSTLQLCIDSLQWFYDIYIKKSKSIRDVPEDLLPTVEQVRSIYNVRYSQAEDV